MNIDETAFDPRFDFSSLSKNRLRIYNMLATELDAARDEDDLSDDDLSMLAAAGYPPMFGQGIDGTSPTWQ